MIVVVVVVVVVESVLRDLSDRYPLIASTNGGCD
jgi:hypothetical protein